MAQVGMQLAFRLFSSLPVSATQKSCNQMATVSFSGPSGQKFLCAASNCHSGY